jgi:hypothetical protein
MKIPSPSALALTRASQHVWIERVSALETRLFLEPPIEGRLASSALLFYREHPLAAYVGDVVYYPDVTLTNAQTLFLHKFASGSPHLRTGDFDFILGSTLTTAGLHLTRRAE